tara:strand:- start:13300 stop:13890 length:591 start_codon:yes stop_codon:yes gene_type:complete
MDGATTPQEAYDMMAYQVSEGNLQGNFVTSMMSQFETKGRLSPKQIEWAIKLSTEAAHKESDPMAYEDEEGDYKSVVDFMTRATVSRPRLTFKTGRTTITMSLAPKTGRNPNHIYVKTDGDYAGKLTPTGDFSSAHHRPVVMAILSDMSADPQSYILGHGVETGNCACCGRDLTDDRSLKAGVGPVCAKHWNIVWG